VEIRRNQTFVMCCRVEGHDLDAKSGDSGNAGSRSRMQEILLENIARYNGQVAAREKSRLTATFERAYQAVGCAADIFRDLRAAQEREGRPRTNELRLGVAGGTEGGGHVSAFDVAARMQALARPGSIAVDRETLDGLGPSISLPADYLEETEVGTESRHRTVQAFRIRTERAAPRNAEAAAGRLAQFAVWIMASALAIVIAVAAIVGWQARYSDGRANGTEAAAGPD